MNWLAVGLVVLAIALAAWLAAAVVVRRNLPPREIAIPAVRILPDIVVLVRRLSDEPELPRSRRLGLLVLRAWLVSPIDLIPDFLPAVGQLDDLIIAVAVLRRVLPHLDPPRLGQLWPGTPEGLALLERLFVGERATSPA
jgi:uncharacterized membrane protein YkvA (DUF1232 family)